jgi:Uma2 family endonuclease
MLLFLLAKNYFSLFLFKILHTMEQIDSLIENPPVAQTEEDEVGAVPMPFPLVLDLSALTKKITDKHLLKLSKKNPHLSFETRGLTKLIISMSTHTKTGNQNFKINVKLGIWQTEHQAGEFYDSSSGFRMPITKSILSPDISYIKHELLATIDTEAEGFYLIAPTFVIELMSDSDRLKPAKEKMIEYMQNGVELAWLIQPKKRRTFVYRQKDFVQNIAPTEQGFDVVLSGEDILPDFLLDLREIFG